MVYLLVDFDIVYQLEIGSEIFWDWSQLLHIHLRMYINFNLANLSSIRPISKSNQISPICIKLCWCCLMQNTARIIKFREHFTFKGKSSHWSSYWSSSTHFGMWSKVLLSKVIKRGHMYFDTSGCNVSKLISPRTTKLTNSIHSKSHCDQSMDKLHWILYLVSPFHFCLAQY